MALDILHCYQTEPPPLDYVLPGFAPATVGSLVSPGGSGKSMLALLLAHLVGAGIDLLELGTYPTGKVTYLSAEDNANILHHRLHTIGAHLTPVQREACALSLLIEDLTAHAPDLAAPDWQGYLERLAQESRLLILDPLKAFHRWDENSATTMGTLVATLKTIAARTSCAILFLHHSSKALAVQGQGDLQQAARGSSVLTDNARWQSYLVGMTKDEAEHLSDHPNGQPIGPEHRGLYVRFGISKQNYGAAFTERWFKRGKGGVLEPVDLWEAKDNLKGGRRSNEL